MLAVPLHGEDVAPRFCSADQFMIAELDGKRVRRLRHLITPDESWSERLGQLAAAGVKVLLCGGFNRSFLPVAEGLGILVIAGLAGEAKRLIEAFLQDELERYQFLPCRGRHSGRHGGRWPRQGLEGELRRGKEQEKCRDTTEPVR
jgi:predicted Fe-Mo cluster-binding NifX family protein